MRSTCSQLNGTASRRVLATRDTDWAKSVARVLAGTGVRPNGVSVAGVAFALAAATAFVISPTWSPGGRAGLLLVAAACIQLRLLCNLLDGMLAVEEGLKTRNGEIFNDLPDRLEDILILVGAGYAARGVSHAETLGWAAAVAAVLTAYVRVLGGSLGLTQHFAGPMAKQHRMFVLTLVTLLAAIESKLDCPAPCNPDRPRDRWRRVDGDVGAVYPTDSARGGRAMIATALASACQLMTGATVEWRCDPDTAVQRIYFGNHSSHLDFVVIWSALPPRLRRHARPVAGRDYWHSTRSGGIRHQRISRGADRPRELRRGRGAQQSIERRAEEMGDRDSLIVFPKERAASTERSARSRAASTISRGQSPMRN